MADDFATPREDFKSQRDADEFTTPRDSARENFATPRVSAREDFSTPRDDSAVASAREKFATPRDNFVTPRAESKGVGSGEEVKTVESQYESAPYSEEKEVQYDDNEGQMGYYTDETQAKAEGGQEDQVEQLFSATRHNRVSEVESMINSGIPIDIRDSMGNTLLAVACQNGLKKMAKFALRRGADINARNYKGNTPLHFCYAYGYGDTLGEYLASKGADTTITNHAGATCFQGLGDQQAKGY